MLDDHKYSVGRTVVFRAEGQGARTGRWAGKASGTVISVELDQDPEPRWMYVVERQRNKRRVRLAEDEILYGVMGKRKSEPSPIQSEERGEQLAGMIERMAADSALSVFLRTTIRDMIRREASEEAARIEGRELPLGPGDYIRIRGDLREELQPFHNYYGKILEALDPDIAGLEASPGSSEPHTYRVVRKYLVLLDDGSQVEIYDPEIKLYYTANRRSTILNWRAASFLAEAFDDDPPYTVEFSYLEDHIFTREELTELNPEKLAQLLASLLYVKGHMGWRDLQEQQRVFRGLSRAYLVDSILNASRFDQRKNRTMTPQEIAERREQGEKLRELLGG